MGFAQGLAAGSQAGSNMVGSYARVRQLNQQKNQFLQRLKYLQQVQSDLNNYRNNDLSQRNAQFLARMQNQNTSLTQVQQIYHAWQTTDDPKYKQVLANKLTEMTTHGSLFGNSGTQMTITDPNTGQQIVVNGSSGSGVTPWQNAGNATPQTNSSQTPQQSTPLPPNDIALPQYQTGQNQGGFLKPVVGPSANTSSYPLSISATTPGNRYGQGRAFQTGVNTGIVGDTTPQQTSDESIVSGVERSLPSLREAASNLGQFQTVWKQLEEKGEGLSNRYLDTDFDLPSQKAEGELAIQKAVEGLIRTVTGKAPTQDIFNKMADKLEPQKGESKEGYVRRITRLVVGEMKISNQGKQRLLHGIPLDPSKPISFSVKQGQEQESEPKKANDQNDLVALAKAEMARRGIS